VSGILILGGTGMLGHVLWRTARERAETRATVRAASPEDVRALLEDPVAVLAGVRAEEPASVQRVLDEAQPEVVVNCIGVVKQSATASPTEMVRINSLFPHELAAACAQRGSRLIHVSTDCVFSGRRGGYTERDIPDPVDLYGRSKLAGEPSGPHVLTLRTSMIGWELGGRRQGLLEWFAAQRGGSAGGYTRAVFSGPTAAVLSRLIVELIDSHPGLSGLWHVGAEPIAKHELLLALREALGLEVEIVPDDRVRIDRSLDATALREATGWTAPPWEEMVAELAAGAPAYARGDSLARR